MKKIISGVFMVLVASTSFATTTHIALTNKQTQSIITEYWSITQPGDTTTFTNTNNYLVSVQVMVTAPSIDFIPDDATVTCSGKDYVIKPGNGIACPVYSNHQLMIKDVNFKNGTSGKYTVAN